MVGIGSYQGATPGSILATRARLVLCHLNPGVAVAVRQADPWALIILRADAGQDAEQADESRSPESEADRFLAERIAPALAAVPPGTYSACLGICEDWRPHDRAYLEWRAAFEYRLCQRVQADHRLPYAWGSIPSGNLEADELPIFAKVLGAAWATAYHGYTRPGRTVLSDETEPWWAWRPLDLWAPKLRTLGLRTRLLCTELGTWEPPSLLHMSADDEARYVVALDGEYRRRCAAAGMEYLGGCAFGFGTLGGQAVWRLDGTESIFAAANAQAAPVGPPPVAVPPQQGGETMTYPSPNHDGPRSKTLGVVIHSTRGGAGDLLTEYRAAVNWLCNPASQSSAHAVVGPSGEVALLVDPANRAWHDRQMNDTHLGIELVQARIGQAIPDATLRAAAKVVAGWCAQYSIPVQWSVERGLCEHRETPPGIAEGKSDIGSPFDRAAFLGLVKAAMPAPPVDAVTSALDGLAYYGSRAREAATRNDWDGVRRNLDDLWERVCRLKAALGRA